jgi:TatD DNase family protein
MPSTNPPELVDIGVNLAHRRFDADRAEVLARARAAGVTRLVVTGTSVASSQAAAALAAQHPHELWSTAGIHPHEAKHATPAALAELRALATSQPGQVRALGECGLDFDRNFSPPAAQEAAFAAQLELAAQLGLPVFLHERRAHERFVAILREHRARLPGAVIHCFTGTRAELDAYVALDLHVGITGWINDDRRGLGLREVVRHIPRERLMLETDAPFLTPHDARPKPAGGRNEPALLPLVLAAVARAVGRPAPEVAEATTRVARAFFALP